MSRTQRWFWCTTTKPYPFVWRFGYNNKNRKLFFSPLVVLTIFINIWNLKSRLFIIGQTFDTFVHLNLCERNISMVSLQDLALFYLWGGGWRQETDGISQFIDQRRGIMIELFLVSARVRTHLICDNSKAFAQGIRTVRNLDFDCGRFCYFYWKI